MTTRIMINTLSDLSLPGGATRVQSASTGTDTNFTVNPPNGGGQATRFFVTEPDVPNNDNWEDSGVWTVEIEIDSGDVEFTGDVRVGRCADDGTILQVGSFIGTQAMDVSRTFSPVAPVWTGGEEACGNRQFIEMLFTNNASHGSHSIQVGVGTTSNEVIDDLSVDVAACVVAGGATPLINSTPLTRLVDGALVN